MNEVKKPGMFSRIKSKVVLGVGAASMMLVPAAAHAQVTFDAGIDETKISQMFGVVAMLFSEFWLLFAIGLALIILPRIISIIKGTASARRA